MLLPRTQERDYRKWMSVQDAWKMATVNGAHICGWEDTGILAPGMRADVVLADLSDIAFWPMNNLMVQALLLAGRLDVTDVWIQGRSVMRNREILCLDENSILQETRNQSKILADRFHIALQKTRDGKKAYMDAYIKHYQIGKGEMHDE